MPSSRKFDQTIVIVTPWLGAFAGGAEALARSTAREFDRRGIPTIILTTCAQSPFDNWWQDHHAPGHSTVAGVDVRRFKTNKVSAPYRAVIEKMQTGIELSTADQQTFFDYNINSSDLISSLEQFMNNDYEILALPYFYGLTHSAAKTYPKKISLIPCFHDEQQFYWPLTGDLLVNAKHIFYNSPEEKQMTIRQYGRAIGRKIVEGTVAGVAVEIAGPEHRDFGSDGFPSLPNDYFVYVGRKEQGKNVPLLCQWFGAHAESTGNTCKLVFIGGGESNLVPRAEHFLELVIANPELLAGLDNDPALVESVIDLFEHSQYFGDQLIRHPELVFELNPAAPGESAIRNAESAIPLSQWGRAATRPEPVDPVHPGLPPPRHVCRRRQQSKRRWHQRHRSSRHLHRLRPVGGFQRNTTTFGAAG